METNKQLTEDEKAVTNEIEQRVKEIKEKSAQVERFKKTSIDALKNLYTMTNPEIIQKVNQDFINAIAESDTTIVEVGRAYRQEMNDAFQDILKTIPKDGRVVDVNTRNSFTAILLNLFEPIENFLKTDEKRRDALMHVNVINAVLRSMNVRYNGCKQQWDAEDAAVEAAKRSLKK